MQMQLVLNISCSHRLYAIASFRLPPRNRDHRPGMAESSTAATNDGQCQNLVYQAQSSTKESTCHRRPGLFYRVPKAFVIETVRHRRRLPGRLVGPDLGPEQPADS